MKAITYIRVSTEEQASEGVSLDAAGNGNALIIYSLSRLSRSTKDTLAIAERIERAGADLVSLSEKIDTTTAAGKMVFRMLAVLAEFERDQLAERTSAAMQFKKSKGELVGAVPYGKELADDGVTLIDNPPEQAVITEARELHGAGLSLRKIAVILAEKGFMARNGKAFAATQIQRMVA